MNYNYLFFGIGLSIGICYYLFKKRSLIYNLLENNNNQEEYGYGYIINVYPVLIIYIKGYILNNNKNNLQQSSYPNGFPEDSYVIIFFDDNFREYIGIVNIDEFTQIKSLIIDSKSQELYAKALGKDFFTSKNSFAEAKLNYLIFTS